MWNAADLPAEVPLWPKTTERWCVDQRTPQSGALASQTGIKHNGKQQHGATTVTRWGWNALKGRANLPHPTLNVETDGWSAIWKYDLSKVKFFCAGIIDVGLGMGAVGGCRVPVCHENLETHVCWAQSGRGGRRTVPSSPAGLFHYCANLHIKCA